MPNENKTGDFRSEEVIVKERKLDSVIYHEYFRRKLSLYWVFLTRWGFVLLLISAYLFYIKGVGFLKVGVFLLFGVFFISKFLMREKFYEKYNITFFNIKGRIMRKKEEIDRHTSNSTDIKYF